MFGESTIAIAESARPLKTVKVGGRVNGLAWAPSGQALYAVVLHDDGLSALDQISIDGSVTVVQGGSRRVSVHQLNFILS